MKTTLTTLLILLIFFTSCDEKNTNPIKMIPISTEYGDFNVWTKRVGNNPSKKVLLLHGGPGANHQYFKGFESYFPGEEIEYYYYDQLGSTLSDNPQIDNLWTIEHYVEEVELILYSFCSLLILCTAFESYRACSKPLVSVLLPAPDGP